MASRALEWIRVLRLYLKFVFKFSKANLAHSLFFMGMFVSASRSRRVHRQIKTRRGLKNPAVMNFRSGLKFSISPLKNKGGLRYLTTANHRTSSAHKFRVFSKTDFKYRFSFSPRAPRVEIVSLGNLFGSWPGIRYISNGAQGYFCRAPYIYTHYTNSCINAAFPREIA